MYHPLQKKCARGPIFEGSWVLVWPAIMGMPDLDLQLSLVFFLNLVNHPSGCIICSPNSSHEAQCCHPNILTLVLLFFIVTVIFIFKAPTCYAFTVRGARLSFHTSQGIKSSGLFLFDETLTSELQILCNIRNIHMFVCMS